MDTKIAYFPRTHGYLDAWPYECQDILMEGSLILENDGTRIHAYMDAWMQKIHICMNVQYECTV
jgi:hypothetical protein